MAQAVRANTRQTTQVSNTTTSFTTELTLSASALTTAGFAANDDVIAFYFVNQEVAESGNHVALQFTYNGTALGEEPTDYKPGGTGNQRRLSSIWWTRVDLGGTVADFDIDIRSVDDPGTAFLNKIEIIVVRFADFGVEGTDVFHNKNTTVEEMTTAYSDSDEGAEITWTPGAVEDWIVLSAVQMFGNAGNIRIESQLVLDPSGTPVVIAGDWSEEWESSSEEKRWTDWALITSLAASEQVVEIQNRDASSGSSSEHRSSELLIFRKDIWTDIYTDEPGTVAVVNDTEVQVATVTDTLSTAQDVVMLGGGNFVADGQAGSSLRALLESDDSDIDPDMSTTDVQRNYDGDDRKQTSLLAIANLSGTLNLDLNLRQNGTVSKNFDDVKLLVWGMELADVAAAPVIRRRQLTTVRM